MVPMDFKSKDSTSIFGFKIYDGIVIDPNYALGAPMAFKSLYQGFKAQRTDLNPGRAPTFSL